MLKIFFSTLLLTQYSIVVLSFCDINITLRGCRYKAINIVPYKPSIPYLKENRTLFHYFFKILHFTTAMIDYDDMEISLDCMAFLKKGYVGIYM